MENRLRFVNGNGHHQTHERPMRLALRLACRALGRTAPNPAVGAVVVKNGRVIAQGYHRFAGAPHAEAEALRRAGRRARGATLYVTLEPCNHVGRTPPCCEAILASGISRVVVGAVDPNPITNGRGIARLRRAGLRVTTGVLADESRRLNEPFWKAMRTGLPLVIAKVGQSLDGKIATAAGRSRWITSAAARRFGHELRSHVDAVLVGVRTVLQDDPRLTARGVPHAPGRPLRVIVDSRLRTPVSARCVSSGRVPTLIATTVPLARVPRVFRRRGVEVWSFPPRRGRAPSLRRRPSAVGPSGGRVPLRRLCRRLASRGIQSVLIEGGGEVLAGALSERLVDHVVFVVAPLLIGGREAPGSVGGEGIRELSQAIRLREVAYSRLGSDLCVEGRVVYPRTGSS